MKRRHHHARRRRQPVRYNPLTGQWTLTWEDKKHSAKTQGMIRKIVGKYS